MKLARTNGVSRLQQLDNFLPCGHILIKKELFILLTCKETMKKNLNYYQHLDEQ
jgi:hypothetical protein